MGSLTTSPEEAWYRRSSRPAAPPPPPSARIELGELARSSSGRLVQVVSRGPVGVAPDLPRSASAAPAPGAAPGARPTNWARRRVGLGAAGRPVLGSRAGKRLARRCRFPWPGGLSDLRRIHHTAGELASRPNRAIRFRRHAAGPRTSSSLSCRKPVGDIAVWLSVTRRPARCRTIVTPWKTRAARAGRGRGRIEEGVSNEARHHDRLEKALKRQVRLDPACGNRPA